jgi:tetratricopeptide (TPR) repeat protein
MRSFSGQLLDEAREAFINGDYKEAETLLEQPSLQKSMNPEIFQMLATIYYNRGQFNKAIKTFKKALEVDPTYSDAAVGLSIILNDIGKYDEAKKVFAEAQALLDRKKQIVPSVNVEEKLASKHLELGDLYLQYKRFDSAIDNYTQAQKLSQKKSDISMLISECYIQAGQKDKAIRELKTVLQMNMKLIAPRLKLGLILYNSNMIAEAVDQWENVLRLEPKNDEALRYLKMAQATGITNLSF